MQTIFRALIIMTIVCGLTGNKIAYAVITPTPQWVSFYSSNSTLDGTPLSIGAIVRAFDEVGNQCGEFVVHTLASYGFLPCYFDDPLTTVDEGVSPGGVVRFAVDGQEADPFQLPSNTTAGEIIQLDLAAMTYKYRTCIDDYERNDTQSASSELTGPEAHTFHSRTFGEDQDWVKFTAQGKHTYQIRARSFQSLGVVHPVLKLYDDKGNLLAENEMDKWGRGAEIWWWNSSEHHKTVYVQAYERNGKFGCLHYTLTLTQWNSGELR